MSLVSRLAASPDRLLKGATDPQLTALVLNKMVHQRRRGKLYNRHGTDIFDDEDWDILVILDACRYDAYADLTPFEGPVERRESKGTASDQWVYGNLHGKQRHDVVYVSGNKWYLKLQSDGVLDAEIHKYHDIDRDAFHGYVPSPQKTTEDALALAHEYPNKRLIVHYMQPHKPYLGDHRDAFEFPEDEDYGLRTVVEKYDIDRETLRAAYRDNLRIVLEYVQTLVAELDGKIVISADHGELLGERIGPIPIRWYGHPNRIYVDELLTVPWHVVSEGPRKTITAEAPADSVTVESDHVDETLRKLGYKV
jgi:hypothetical protein